MSQLSETNATLPQWFNDICQTAQRAAEQAMEAKQAQMAAEARADATQKSLHAVLEDIANAASPDLLNAHETPLMRAAAAGWLRLWGNALQRQAYLERTGWTFDRSGLWHNKTQNIEGVRLDTAFEVQSKHDIEPFRSLATR